jgi:cytidylate kinase
MKEPITLAEYGQSHASPERPPCSYPFVTVSRLAGAGGRTLATAILKRLNARTSDEWAQGWEVCDWQLCLRIVKDPEMNASLESLLTEEYKKESKVFFKELLTGKCQQYALNKRVLGIVRALALRGKSIIVGRAGSFATRDLTSGVHIRLVAPEEMRVKVMMKVLAETEATARDEMYSQDDSRAHFVREFFCGDIDDPVGYHIVVNTGLVSIDAAALFVEHLLVEKARKCAAAPL